MHPMDYVNEPPLAFFILHFVHIVLKKEEEKVNLTKVRWREYEK